MCKQRLGAGLDVGVPAFVVSVIQLSDGHHSLVEAVRGACSVEGSQGGLHRCRSETVLVLPRCEDTQWSRARSKAQISR